MEGKPHVGNGAGPVQFHHIKVKAQVGGMELPARVAPNRPRVPSPSAAREKSGNARDAPISAP